MRKEARVLHIGDVFLNKYAGWRTLFVLTKTSGRFCNGISLVRFYGEDKISEAQYYKESIQYDDEAFPLVGHINIKELWKVAILHSLTTDDFMKEYEDSGMRRRKNS